MRESFSPKPRLGCGFEPAYLLSLLSLLYGSVSREAVDVVGGVGLEPTTSCVWGRRSNQLSYPPGVQSHLGLEIIA